MFLCEVSPGVLWLDLAAEGAFVLWSLQLLLWRLKVCSSAVAWQEKGLTYSSITRFGCKRCIYTLELATSTAGLEGAFLCGSSTIVTDSPDLHLFDWIRNKGVFFSLKYPYQSCYCIISKIFYFNITIELRNLKKCCEVLRACLREHREVVLHAITPISMKLCQLTGSTPKLKKTNWFLVWFFPGGDRPPPVFLGFHQGNRFKIGKMYEALTAMVFNQLLWGFAHTFFHP